MIVVVVAVDDDDEVRELSEESWLGSEMLTL